MSTKNKLLPVQTTLQSRGRLLDLSRPVVMGILNATPDSFYNKGRESSLDELIQKAGSMLEEGAAILDIGGASSRPGTALMPPDLETERVAPVITGIARAFPEAWISVDTYNAATAKAAVGAGALIVNDISGGGFDEAMIETVAALGVPFITMHIQGTPATMQKDPQYTDVVREVAEALIASVQQCEAAGITDIIIDPGFGFGKTVAHNFQLLQQLHTFRIAGKPVLAGLSRKSMICRTLNIQPEEALNGTTALNVIALQQGASILRVHDVKEAMEAIKLMEMVEGCTDK